MKCNRCSKKIIKNYFYQLIDDTLVCSDCAVIGEKLMPDDEGDLYVSEYGKELFMSIENE